MRQNKKGFKFDLRDETGKEIYEGDIVKNKEGKQAKVRLGKYTHYIGGLSSPAYGIYFDGDPGFYFSEHLLRNKKVAVKVLK
ncbi:MAG: hypothetical protein IH948_00265 [Bacteroidetes bacterium]|nr:hypothetical protein [Bacteroidota bacterium]